MVGVFVRVYLQITSGEVTIVRPERRVLRQLGPILVHAEAARELVFDTIAAPYLGPSAGGSEGQA